MTPCGVVPAVAKSVNALLEYAAGHIGRFETDRFKAAVEQGFYDFDEAPHKQMLYAALLTVSHIWNQTMKSCIEVRAAKKSKDHPADFEVLFHAFADQVGAARARAVIHCPEQREIDGCIKSAPCRENIKILPGTDPLNNMRFSEKKILENPFGIAGEIIKRMAPEEWRTYEWINVGRLPLR